MHIKELISIVDEAAKPKVKPDGKGGFVDAQTGEPVDNTIPFPNQQGGQPAGSAAPSAASTMDPRVAQPIDAQPQQPKKTFAQKLGTVAANVGAIPGAFKGMKTAYQKGKADMAQRVGGPVNQPAGGTATAGGAAPAQSAAGQSDIDDLRQMINKLDARLTKHGLNQQ